MRRRVRLIAGLVATVVIIAPLVWMWAASRMPARYSVMEMGRVDTGGAGGHHDHGAMGGRSVASYVVDPTREPDVALTLTARKERFILASGRAVDGYTLDHLSPGPSIEARAGQLVQVTLVNESVPGGVTLHWHGLDVPNAMDGVAGVTQDAVAVGGSFTYRWVADQVGTFWYHSHQISHEQVRDGLLGALVIRPARAADPAPADVVALSHLYAGLRTVNGRDGDLAVPLAPAVPVRVRIINTDNGVLAAWVGGTAFRVAAVDGVEVSRPTDVADRTVLVAAGGRVDLELVLPADGRSIRVQLGGSAGVVLGRGPSPAAVPQPTQTFDPLGYGTPAPVGFDPTRPDREFAYAIGRRLGFVHGRPGMFWTINGRLFPDVPMYVVREGDVVRMTLSNRSREAHPMHLHGHHALVLSRNGVAATGSPWWVDSLTVADGESYEIAFRADNPGLWMDHCHNLPHAQDGLVAHLAYEGVTTPYVIGGAAANEPE